MQRFRAGNASVTFRSIAQSLYDKMYDLTYRVQAYQPYRELNDLAAEMKTGRYNPFENPTGIYFKDGEEAIVIVGNTHGERVALKVYDFDAVNYGKRTPDPTSYPLREGINKLRIAQRGLSYVEYYTPNWKTALELKLHIASGTVNGYYDKHWDASADWRGLLDKATYGCIDIKGDWVNLVFGVNSVKTHCDNLGKLIQNYDDIVGLEHELMGLDKYNRRPKKHMFARVTKDGLFADGWGAGWYEGCMSELANTTKTLVYGRR
ncbi:M60 family peptidase N-terminal accessory domain-containing protein [uncultured Bacteroides sp.]|uniref:M60 family peptidase N-terminal accessory domain-containing protein n=1 Tax=uncultured Bacteroides sp. TaxID=162156 RepID=UPI0025E68E33|nr:M60 family peptidase N-terminal accessory domain-containing protein [uncultured Bacteroides sp.]